MAKLGVVPLKADNTRPNALIDAWLRRFGKGGVPMYVLLPADPSREPWVLPELLTPGLVVDALREAARGGDRASGRK